MLKMGIIDPSKVLRCAIENAVSAAMMLLTLDAIVVDEKVKDQYSVQTGFDLSDAM